MPRYPFRKSLAGVFVMISLWSFLWLFFQEGRIAAITNIYGFWPIEQVLERGRQKREDKSRRAEAFVKDVLCPGCRHAIADPNDKESERCGVYIERELLLQSDNPNLEIATVASSVTRRFPVGCRLCEPSARCSSKKYWRYDAAAPLVLKSKAVDEWLPDSLPVQHRLPASATINLTAYFMNAKHVFPAAEYFMEYNPSIVVLSETQTRGLHLLASDRYYLVSFRVSNQHYCFHPDDRKLMAGATTASKKSTQKAQNYLGLAIYDSNLNHVRDTIVDLKAIGFPAAQDFRLFVLQNQIYISSYDLLAPIWLAMAPNDRTVAQTIVAPTVFKNRNKLHVHIGKEPSCASCNQKRGFCGKNFNYFVDSSGNRMAEIWPTGPHMVRSIDLHKPCQRGQEPDAAFVGIKGVDTMPSFATVEELDFPALGRWKSILTRGRGGTCCIPMQHEKLSLLVGIQHSKTPSQHNKQLPNNITANHYLSSFYAFQTTPPYRIVAQSGWFCMGFPHEDVTLVRATSWRQLVIGRPFDCPRIHFVSGMTIKADDPSSVIVVYGINDCLSRFVEIRLSDVKDLLYGSLRT